MGNIAVVTDTTHYLPRELVETNVIAQVSLYVNQGGRQQREADMDLDAFYAQLVEDRGPTTTSQPSVGDFLAVYDPLLSEGRDIVSVHIAGAISGTVEAARQAAAEATAGGTRGRIAVIDSDTGAGGLGMVVLAAAAAARTGADLEAVVARTEAAKGDAPVWFAVDTLEYLRRGGRIGAAQAWLGAALKIKPILTFDGEVTPFERVRTSGRAFERLVELLRARHDDGADGWVVQHIRAPDQAARMVDRGREIFGRDPLFVSEIGPVVGAHLGPGLLGVGGVPRSLLGSD